MMKKPSNKVRFDSMICFNFLNNIWMSSCRDNEIAYLAFMWWKHDEEVAI